MIGPNYGKQGQWIRIWENHFPDDVIHRCSQCGIIIGKAKTATADWLPGDYCPNCHADMRSKADFKCVLIHSGTQQKG